MSKPIATFHSYRGEKSALIMVKANQFVFSGDPVYIPRTSLPSNLIEAVDALKEGEELKKDDPLKVFNIPEGYSLTPLTNEDGSIRTTTSGETLHKLNYVTA